MAEETEISNDPPSGRRLYEPNRIRELREDRGWSQEALADMIGTTAAQIGKLERRERKPSLGWLKKLAEAFDVAILEILDQAAMASSEPDVRSIEGGAHAKALAQRGLRYYEVVTDACSDVDFLPGQTILVDQSAGGIAHPGDGDIVLVEHRRNKNETVLLLRSFLLPDKVMTNRSKNVVSMKLGKHSKIIGVVVPENNTKS